MVVVVTPINMFGYLLITAETGDHSSKLLLRVSNFWRPLSAPTTPPYTLSARHFWRFQFDWSSTSGATWRNLNSSSLNSFDERKSGRVSNVATMCVIKSTYPATCNRCVVSSDESKNSNFILLFYFFSRLLLLVSCCWARSSVDCDNLELRRLV